LPFPETACAAAAVAVAAAAAAAAAAPPVRLTVQPSQPAQQSQTPPLQLPSNAAPFTGRPADLSIMPC
jgi:hypothetical protein